MLEIWVGHADSLSATDDALSQTSLLMSGLRRMSGNEFQTGGVEDQPQRRCVGQTIKHNILSRYTAVSRKVDDWQITDAVTRDVTSETDRQCAEWQVLRHLTVNTAENHDTEPWTRLLRERQAIVKLWFWVEKPRQSHDLTYCMVPVGGDHTDSCQLHLVC